MLQLSNEHFAFKFQVIDLTRVSQELAFLASDADLVILEGMVSLWTFGIGTFKAFLLTIPNDNFIGQEGQFKFPRTMIKLFAYVDYRTDYFAEN